MSTSAFRAIIRRHYRSRGRDLPWRRTRIPYRILVSEIMLQQTGTGRVAEKYAGFLRSFPSLRSLAKASIREVLESWKGLGYNRRALYLHQTATILSTLHGGRIPRSRQELARLPGIGMATASAVLAFAFDTPVAFIETNIRRVFLHFYFLEQERVKDSEILPLVEKTLDRRNPREWYYALMDYGAMLGARDRNPNLRSAHYRRQSAFEGSVRQARGMVLAVLLRWPRATRAQIAKNTGKKGDLLDRALSQLVEEGFVKKRGTEYFIP